MYTPITNDLSFARAYYLHVTPTYNTLLLFNQVSFSRKFICNIGIYIVLLEPAVSFIHVFLYFSKGCGHCKAMKPEYVDAAQTMKDEEVSKPFLHS